MTKLRDYQIELANKGADILNRKKIVYLNLEVRTGKTLTALEIAKLFGAKNVLFATKKKAIQSILKDYFDFGYNDVFDILVINNESLHKIEDKFDLVIHDESHRCFLGNTLINGVKIKDIDVGSFQKSFNFAKGIYEYKKVLNVFKNPLTENLIKIKCNGKEIICTESHKIFTKRGWVKAGELLPKDELQVV
jgi:hypothetical protein